MMIGVLLCLEVGRGAAAPAAPTAVCSRFLPAWSNDGGPPANSPKAGEPTLFNSFDSPDSGPKNEASLGAPAWVVARGRAANSSSLRPFPV
jgi:hypothetical protein